MSGNYDYALALIENDVRNDCEYYVYSRLRDAVDGLENDNEALTKLLKDALEKKYSKEDELQAENAKLRELCAAMFEDLDGLMGEDDVMLVDNGRSRRLFSRNDVDSYRNRLCELVIEVSHG